MKNVKAVSIDNNFYYIILDWDIPKGIDCALVLRDTTFQPFVVAHWPKMEGEVLTWGQGHYFDNIIDAVTYYRTVLNGGEEE